MPLPDSDVAFGSIRALTERISRGDEAAFNTFYQSFSPKLFRLFSIVTRGDAHLTRDLHQSVMVTSARKMKTFPTEPELWAWLAQVARNKWKDVCRKRMREGRALALYTAPASASPPFDQLTDALKNLSAEERYLVEIFYFDNLSQEQISSSSGRTIKAIQSALARIRSKLRANLKERL